MTAPPLSTAKLQHGKIAWREAGSGSPLVFLHGLAVNNREWLPLFPRLARDFRVIAWDCPGYGGSDQLPMAKPDVHAYADALKALLDHLEIEHAGVVGDSLGGLIAAALAGSAPDRVDLLVLSGMKPKPSEQEANEYLQWLQDLMTAGGQDFARRFAARLVAPGCDASARVWVSGMVSELNPIGFGRACHMVANTDAIELFKIVRAPLFLIHGELDEIAPAAEGRPIERVVRGAVTEIMTDTGHVPAVEKPEMLHRSLRGFLRAARYR